MPITRSLSHSRGLMQLAHSKPGHPIQSAPDDILRYIFEWTMADSVDSGDSDSPPWVLGQVCRRWRTVSRGHPPLWARISIRLVPSTRGRQARSGSGRTIEHLRLLLDLSKASLLHIDLHLPVQDAAVSTVLLPILREHTHRWAALQIRYAPAVCGDVQVPLYDPRSLYFIRALSGAPFPTLGSLAISFPPSSTWQTETLAATTVIFDAFCNATSLRSAVLDTESGVFPVPCGDLRQYQAAFNSSLVELPTLRRVENLRVCLNESVLARWRQSNAYPTTWVESSS
ncbi:hypothetical protein CYLTODRAFT_166765 [Cylindrobasidium torrendii FP15055 ss-10]|uniref:Uncharacterized protein n=1 Tax=Cylindrobasidium torrendii FP15055 ss-10 TaxID=1314674 RepID=A0A0D7AXW2_9AGAR|nr:hypothetical protein CYLTODRAFT_166765 [Cylindrobasidium torrendii FP15055 ss-10]